MQVENGKVSIIMPVKNGSDYIQQAISSVLSQGYQEWELIIIDDGSTDDTYHKVLPFLVDSRVKLLKNQVSLGVARTINIGIENSKGEYFARIDADDIWTNPNKLELQVKYLNNHLDCSVVGTWGVAGAENDRKQYTFHHPLDDINIRNRVTFRNPFVSSSILARMDLIRRAGAYLTKDLLAEDYGLSFRLLDLGKGANIAIEAVWYRLNEKGITSSKYREQVKSAEMVVRHYGRSYPNYYLAILKWMAHSIFSMLANQKMINGLKAVFNKT